MELFFAEHKKLWSRNYVKVSVLLCFVYIVVFGGILQYQWFSLGSSKDITGNHFDGYEYIRGRQEYARKYGPKLTDETLAEMAMDYQRAANSNNDEEIKLSDWSVISSWMQFLYPEQQRADTYQLMLGYVDPEALTDLYGRRQNAIDEYMEASGIDGKEKEYLLSMNDKVEIPFSYVWTEGWRTVLGHMLPDFGMMLAIVIVERINKIYISQITHHKLGLNHATIEQFKRIMIALDAIALKDPELFDLLMLGEYKASYEKIQEMSGRSQRHLQEERRRFQRQMKQKLSLEKAVPLRKDLGSDRLKTEEIPLSVGIKEMPIFDPDMELRGLGSR